MRSNPIDCVDLGVARIAVLGDPLLNAPSAGVITGEAHGRQVVAHDQACRMSDFPQLCPMDEKII
jgi:hypothetical protein